MRQLGPHREDHVSTTAQRDYNAADGGNLTSSSAAPSHLGAEPVVRKIQSDTLPNFATKPVLDSGDAVPFVITGGGVGSSTLRKHGVAKGGNSKRVCSNYGNPRPGGLKHMGLAFWPEFHKALKQYAADKHLTMTHVIVDAVARRMKRAGYWPVLTAEANERRKRRRIQRMVEGRQRQRRAAGEGRTRLGPKGGRLIARPPSPIGARRCPDS